MPRRLRSRPVGHAAATALAHRRPQHRPHRRPGRARDGDGLPHDRRGGGPRVQRGGDHDLRPQQLRFQHAALRLRRRRRHVRHRRGRAYFAEHVAGTRQLRDLVAEVRRDRRQHRRLRRVGGRPVVVLGNDGDPAAGRACSRAEHRPDRPPGGAGDGLGVPRQHQPAGRRVQGQEPCVRRPCAVRLLRRHLRGRGRLGSSQRGPRRQARDRDQAGARRLRARRERVRGAGPAVRRFAGADADRVRPVATTAARADHRRVAEPGADRPAADRRHWSALLPQRAGRRHRVPG